MAKSKIQTSLRVAPDVLEKITYIAELNHRSFNGQIECLIELCIEEYEKEHGVIPTTEDFGSIE